MLLSLGGRIRLYIPSVREGARVESFSGRSRAFENYSLRSSLSLYLSGKVRAGRAHFALHRDAYLLSFPSSQTQRIKLVVTVGTGHRAGETRVSHFSVSPLVA